MEIDAIDLKILDVLQRNARISNAELAQSVGLSPSPCLRRIRNLEKAGVISKYAAILDQTVVELSISVFVQVTLERQVESALETFERLIRERAEVLECYLMTGDADYLLRIVVPDVAAYDDFYRRLILKIDHTGVSSSFAMERIKFTTALPLDYA